MVDKEQQMIKTKLIKKLGYFPFISKDIAKKKWKDANNGYQDDII